MGQEEAVLECSDCACRTQCGSGEEERQVHSARSVPHQDPGEASHQGRAKADVRADGDGESNEGEDCREGLSYRSPEECGLRQGFRCPWNILQSVMRSFLHSGYELRRIRSAGKKGTAAQ